VTRRAIALIAVVALLGGSVVAPFVAAPGPVPPKVEPAEPPPPPSPPSTSAPSAPPPPPTPAAPAKDAKPACGVASDVGLERWIDQASAALVWHEEAPITDRAAVRTIIFYESSGDPCAFNGWDSNALAGIPSKGLIQAIGPTFARWHLPGYGDTYHPVDSTIAGVRYARGRYGSESRVPGVVGVRAGHGYVGY
jgi:hypothetical protein